MFLYWEGYEIDGSDTDFNIVLPENVQISELVDCFLNIPLFDKKKKPEFFFYKGNKRVDITYEELKQKILRGKHEVMGITINCCHLEELEESLYQKIYSISERRVPHEAAYGKVKNPCTPPKKQTYYTRGEMTVQLCIDSPPVHNKSDESYYDGYMTNMELIKNSDGALPCVQLNVGPSFYYEYVIYIVDYLRDQFPSIATFGGLDCAGGWTEGCTYADSIYSHEKFDIPVKYSVKNTLKRLCEYDILCPGIWYYQKKWKYKRTDGFFLENDMPFDVWGKEKKKAKSLSFREYADLAEEIFTSKERVFDMIIHTAIAIILPAPENYRMCTEAYKKLERVKREYDCESDWYYTGYFCFFKKEGKEYAQFRVPYQISPYLNTLLECMEKGELEAIKQETYRRRHE